MEYFPIIISSPSGGGKTTVANQILRRDKNLSRVITATTRAPRRGEINGKDYHFWTAKRFESAVKNNLMAEWAKVHADYYGIPKISINGVIKKRRLPLLVIDVQGARTIKKIYKNAVSIFMAPPNMAELKKRISARNDGTRDIKMRMQSAKKEMAQIKFYDYLVVNDVLEKAVEECMAIIVAETKKVRRIKNDAGKRF
ncbi:MAG: guanylate kinase [Elusimicrobiota bacterium]|jgi:guanylate kinase|nr:guanylate kinase [Elusimicrobiota bacterium]